MNNHENDFIKNLMKAALLSGISAEMQKIDSRKSMAEMPEGTKMSRQYLEHHPSIDTGITDKDMLLLQIDMALDVKDAERFMQLTDELKGMEVLV